MSISIHSAAVEQVQAAYRQFSSDFQKGDARAVMSLFARSDSVFVFDVGPPREHIGWNSYLTDLQGFFSKLELPIEHTVHDLDITVSGDVAYTHSLQEVSGRFKTGKPYHALVRVTDVLRRIDGRWLFVQEHISVPVDPVTGKGEFGP